MRSGARFATPTGQQGTQRRGYSRPRPSSPGLSVRSWANVNAATEKRRIDEQHTPQVQRRPRPSAFSVSAVTSMPDLRDPVPLTSSAPGASVHHMLTELVGLSQGIAAILEHSQLSPGSASNASERRHEAVLKTQEIERIVRRVEMHFADRLQSLESANAALTDEVKRLRLARNSPHREVLDGTKGLSNDVRRGLKEEWDALEDLDKAWSSGGYGSSSGEADQLRRVLLAEKRQRLRVEEQTQSLTEQHAKVVGTLERRLKKQEEQLHELIVAIDAGKNGTANPVTPSPARRSEQGSPYRRTTPRHLLRQQLVQHQQTQRELQEYKDKLRLETPSPAESEGDASLVDHDVENVQRTLQSIRSSKPVTVQEQMLSQPPADAPAVSALPSLSPRSSPRTVPQPDAEVDAIAVFLDNITMELESLKDA